MIKKILFLSFFALLILTPLLFTKYTSELFEYNKMMFVYVLTSIITGSWIIRMISEKNLIFKQTPLDIPLFLFLISQIISTIFSIDVHTSIWGYYSRSNGGLLSTISYLLLYWAFVSNFNKADVLKFLKASVLSGVLASLYAIPEHFGISPSCIWFTQELNASCWVQDVQARVFGTIGQPNWLAALLGMLIFPAFYFFLTAKSNLSRILYLISIILMYAAFTFTFSRGATLGLIAGVIIFALAIAVRINLWGLGFINELLQSQSSREPDKSSDKNHQQYAPLIGILIVILIAMNIYYGSALTSFKLENSLIAARPSLLQSGGAPASGGTQLENGGTESGQIRLIVWKGALEVFKHYPIFGSGVETFAYSYYQYRPLEHNLVSEWDFLYNKAHNEYLNYLATTGAVGFITYMTIILVFIGFCLAVIFKSKVLVSAFNLQISKLNTEDMVLVTGLLAGYTAYLIQNFFLFSVVNVSLLFYLFPAFAFVFTETNKPISENNILYGNIKSFINFIAKNKISGWIAKGLIVLIICFCLVNLYNIWEADKFYKIGSDYNDLGNPGKAYSNLIQAVRLNPKEPLFLAELGNAAASSSLAIASEDATTSAELKDDAQFFTDLALSISPVNTTITRTAIRTYFQLALADPELKTKTMDIVNKSISMSPTDPKLLHNKGIILSQFEDIKEATASLREAIKLKPNYRDARLSLADVYIKNNQKDLATAEIDAVLKLIPGDPDALKLMDQLK